MLVSDWSSAVCSSDLNWPSSTPRSVVGSSLPKIGRELPTTLLGVLEGQLYVYAGYLLTLSALLDRQSVVEGYGVLHGIRRDAHRDDRLRCSSLCAYRN